VARDRKRAKQRRDRSARRSGARGTAGAVPTPNVPGELEHASSGADEFDAALVRGAGGLPAPVEEQELADGAEEQELPDGSEDALQTLGSGGGDVPGRGGRGGDGGGGEERPSGAPLRGGNKVTGFLRASWAELQRVQWPDRRQVSQATAVVLGFVAIAGAYLGLADFVAKEIVEFIL
jgi:preprotein translocase subunit SecE